MNFIIDGIFVAHAIGTNGISAVNIVFPLILLTISLARCSARRECACCCTVGCGEASVCPAEFLASCRWLCCTQYITCRFGTAFFILFYTASVRMTCFTRFVRHMRARFFWRLRSPWQALFLISSSLRRGSRGLRCFLRSSAGS